jgi:hypothetical protein
MSYETEKILVLFSYETVHNAPPTLIPLFLKFELKTAKVLNFANTQLLETVTLVLNWNSKQPQYQNLIALCEEVTQEQSMASLIVVTHSGTSGNMPNNASCKGSTSAE